ncbi:MAG: moaE family protein [Rhizobacter sp.]|nr:moaE family protein [Rhizobacter sp.]
MTEPSAAAVPLEATRVPRVRVQTHDFSLNDEVERLRLADAGVGAVVSFVGCVRDMGSGVAVSAMELEHYPGMTERSIETMVDAAHERFDIRGAMVIHRVGRLLPTEQIVLVAVSSAHRGQAFGACEFLMDYLKSEAPFWKKEETPAGSAWVDARSSDDTALSRWGVIASNVVLPVPPEPT